MSFFPGAPQNIGAGVAGGTSGPSKGGTNAFDAPYRRNPGTRVRLSRDTKYTAPGILTEQFQFPAPPLDQLQRTLTYNWGDYDTIAAGQFSRPSSLQLQTISFDSIIVADDYPWAFYNPKRVRGWDPDEMGRELGRILRSGSPFHLLIDEVQYKPDSSGTASGVTFDFGSSPVISMLATLRQFIATKKAGEPDALYVTCAFTEHRIAGTTQSKLGTSGGGTGQGAKGGQGSRNLPAYIGMQVFAGMLGPKPPQNTLQELAVTYYGSAARWVDIKGANSWLGNIQATHDLGTWDTAALKAAGKANKQLLIPVSKG